MILATHISEADADCVLCDVKRLDDMMHHLIVPVFDVIVAHDVPTACKRVLNRIIDELSDLDDTSLIPDDVDIALNDNELNSDNFRVFDVRIRDGFYGQIALRRVEVE